MSDNWLELLSIESRLETFKKMEISVLGPVPGFPHIVTVTGLETRSSGDGTVAKNAQLW